jgi:hypothetical protein
MPGFIVLSIVLGQDAPKRPSVLLFEVDAQYLAVGHSKVLKPDEKLKTKIKLTSVEDGVLFDIDGDGDLDQVAWTETGAEVAFLALDIDGNGQITSGKELFGELMFAEARSGADSLIQTSDKSGDGKSASVEAGHKLYDRLLLWTDRNHDGISESSELRPAKELFTAIGLGFMKLANQRDEHGNQFLFAGWAEVRTGGHEQGRAVIREEHSLRNRNFYDVALNVR